MGLAEVSQQLFDVLSLLVTAPCRGTATTTGTDWVLRGQVGALPGGRLVRVTSTTRAGQPTPIRLLELQASTPAANFSGVAGGAVITWRSPPTGVGSTAVVTAPFAADPRATVSVAFAAASTDLADGADLMGSARAAGSTGIVLMPAGVKTRIMTTRGDVRMNALWRLRVLSSNTQPDPIRATLTMRIFDALTTVLQHAAVGDETARIGSWTRAKVDGHEAWDLEVNTIFTADDDAFAADPPTFDELDATIDATQGAQPVLTTISL